jgi:hypothetical protein
MTKGESMTPEQQVDLLLHTSMCFLAISNFLSDSKNALDNDVELKSLEDVMLAAHFYMQERNRNIGAFGLSALTVEQAEKLCARRKELAVRLRSAASLLEQNAEDRCEAMRDYIPNQQTPVTTSRQLLPQLVNC